MSHLSIETSVPHQPHAELLMEKDTLVVSIDFDGCADTPQGKTQIIRDILAFIAQYPTVKHIVVMIGSLRQSLRCDLINAENNQECHDGKLLSCHDIGAGFIEQLRLALAAQETTTAPPTIEFDPLMMSDILNELELGTTYKALRKCHEKLATSGHVPTFIIEPVPKKYIDLLNQSNDGRVKHSFEWLDISKISTIVIQMQHIAQKCTNTHFRFYDDRTDILISLYHHLNTYTLVPPQMTFDCALNFDGLFDIPFQPLQGAGILIPNYKALLFHFAHTLPNPELHPELESTLISLYHTYLSWHVLPSEVTKQEAPAPAPTPAQDQSPPPTKPSLIRPVPRKPAEGSMSFNLFQPYTAETMDTVAPKSIFNPTSA